MNHLITSNIFGSLTADDLPTSNDDATAGTDTSAFDTAKAGKTKRNAGRAKAIKGMAADGLGTFKPKKADAETAAPTKKALFAKKAGAKAEPKTKPVKAKAEKPAKAKAPAKAKEPKAATTKVTPAAIENPIDALAERFEAGKADIRTLLQAAYDAGKASPRTRAPRAGGPSKRDIAADLLKRKGGCTAKDILEATGWPTVSVPAIARAAGLTLTQTKEGRTTTYFGS